MSIHKSYFSKSDTLIYNSYTNTARNPIVELFFGRVNNLISPIGFSRYIFDLDLTTLIEKYNSGIISTDCNTNITHTLRMTNTSAFDRELLNTTMSNGRRRATSFDLILFKIPKTSGTTGSEQTWDSGVGYDYYNSSNSLNSSNAEITGLETITDRNFSDRPANWFQRTTIDDWSLPGLYDNTNSLSANTGLNYSAITIVDVQHFEFGNEDIEFDITNEINNILTGGTTDGAGWGIAFKPSVENISGMTENYSVGFFSPHTQTFYEPFLETNYDDLILDDRNIFTENSNNSLYLYSYNNGNPLNLDSNPVVDILDEDGNPVSGFTGLSTCLVTEGVYKVDIDGLTATTVPCFYYDKWYDLNVDGKTIADIENEFVLRSFSDQFQIGTRTETPKLYGFDFSGIKQDEKILNTDIRKVDVYIKQAYSTAVVINDIEAFYRIYVREGTTEVQVQDWTQINRTPDGYYFVFDMRDKIPNEYFVDIKVNSNRNIDTYKRQLKFQIVNRK
jgi:hypothetical protein